MFIEIRFANNFIYERFDDKVFEHLLGVRRLINEGVRTQTPWYELTVFAGDPLLERRLQILLKFGCD